VITGEQMPATPKETKQVDPLEQSAEGFKTIF
jgi:hypothetical protein